MEAGGAVECEEVGGCREVSGMASRAVDDKGGGGRSLKLECNLGAQAELREAGKDCRPRYGIHVSDKYCAARLTGDGAQGEPAGGMWAGREANLVLGAIERDAIGGGGERWAQPNSLDGRGDGSVWDVESDWGAGATDARVGRIRRSGYGGCPCLEGDGGASGYCAGAYEHGRVQRACEKGSARGARGSHGVLARQAKVELRASDGRNRAYREGYACQVPCRSARGDAQPRGACSGMTACGAGFDVALTVLLRSLVLSEPTAAEMGELGSATMRRSEGGRQEGNVLLWEGYPSTL